MNALYDLIAPLQSWLFEQLILPVIFYFEFSSWTDDIYDATGDCLLGLLSVLIVYIVLRPLEYFKPIEIWQNRNEVRVDIIYTMLSRSGILPLIFFLILDPLLSELENQLHVNNIFSVHLEHLFPLLNQSPFLAFLIYIIIFDFAEYIRHRLQHRFNWWWSLHSIHHSQRQMSLWSDERNHIIDGLIKALWLALLGVLLGVPGGQFLMIIIFMKFIESLSHTNVNLTFGPILSRVLVSPVYHRIHHGIGVGHEGQYQGCNFAVLFPIWDILFKTANFSSNAVPTGIRDQLDGVNYGKGFLEQQYIGLRRMFGKF